MGISCYILSLMMPLQFQAHRGFTLIELLVVIAIIGILAAIVLSALGTARGRAKDAARLSSLKQIVNVMNLNYSATVSFWSGGSCNSLPHQDITTCGATPVDLTKFKDPQSGLPACGAAPSAPCQFSISSTRGLIPTNQDWMVCSYLEAPTGSYAAGPIAVSSSTSTPFQTAGVCL